MYRWLFATTLISACSMSDFVRFPIVVWSTMAVDSSLLRVQSVRGTNKLSWCFHCYPNYFTVGCGTTCTPGIVRFVFRCEFKSKAATSSADMSQDCKSPEVSVVSAGCCFVGYTMNLMVCLLTSTMRSAAVATSSRNGVFEAASIDCIPTDRRSNHNDFKNACQT